MWRRLVSSSLPATPNGLPGLFWTLLAALSWSNGLPGSSRRGVLLNGMATIVLETASSFKTRVVIGGYDHPGVNQERAILDV